MRVMAQMAMVMNLDNVHRLPHLLGDMQTGLDQPAGHRVRVVQQRRNPPRRGIPAPTRDQDRWRGGWVRDAKGRLRKAGRTTAAQLLHIFQPEAALHRRHHEPWTYDYDNLTSGSAGRTTLSGGPAAQPGSAANR